MPTPPQADLRQPLLRLQPAAPERPASLPDPLGDDDAVERAGTGGKRRRKRSRVRTALLTVATLFALLLVAGVAGMELVSRRVLDDVERIPNVFGPIDQADRPLKPSGTEETLNFLLVGVDTHGEARATGATETSQVIMLMHLAADRRSAAFVSIPRDSWVTVPGRGPGKINSAYAAGGPPLLIRTVEELTALRIDHFGVLDFAGFKDITNAVGGVDVRVARSSSGFPAGMNHFDGDAALRYVRQRQAVPGGYLEQVRRQHDIMKGLMTKAGSVGLLSSPRKTLTLVESVARAISVDDSLDDSKMRTLALSLRNLRPDSVDFLTAPVSSPGRAGNRAVVRLDTPRARTLWAAIGRDDVASYLRTNPAAATPQ